MGQGGTSKGKSAATQSDPTAIQLAQIAKRQEKETAGLRKDLIALYQSAIAGDISKIPFASQTEEQVRLGASKAREETRKELARTPGVSGTPFEKRILSEQDLEAEIAAQTATAAIVQRLMDMAPAYVQGQTGTAMQGLSGAVGANVGTRGGTYGFGYQSPNITGAGK
jgi:hypothetical protein